RVLGTRAALYAGAVYALNSKAIYYAQEARAYSMALFGATLSIYFFLALLERESWRRWIGYAVTTLFTCIAHLIYTLTVVAQASFPFSFYLPGGPPLGFSGRLLRPQVVLPLLPLPLAPIILPMASSRAALGSVFPKPTLAAFVHQVTWPELALAATLALLSIPRLVMTRQRWRESSLTEKTLLRVGLACLAILPVAAILAQIGAV